MFFLLSRYYQQRRVVPQVLADGKYLVADYTFQKDALFARINLSGDELDMYYRVHEALAEKIPLPNLIVYLRADTEILMQRIAFRDRSYERKMEEEYIHRLNQSYDQFFTQAHPNTPTLTIDTNLLNIVSHPEDLKLIETRIRQALKMAPFQAELPYLNKMEN
jgi:deoxyguanosine kinase